MTPKKIQGGENGGNGGNGGSEFGQVGKVNRKLPSSTSGCGEDDKMEDGVTEVSGVESWGRLQWNYITFYALIHLLGVYGLWATVSGWVKWQTMVAAYVEVILGTLGILAGGIFKIKLNFTLKTIVTFVLAHRLWAHRSYKAKLPLRYVCIIRCI